MHGGNCYAPVLELLAAETARELGVSVVHRLHVFLHPLQGPVHLVRAVLAEKFLEMAKHKTHYNVSEGGYYVRVCVCVCVCA